MTEENQTTEFKDWHLYLGCDVATREELYNSPGLKLIGIEDSVCCVRDEGIKLSYRVNVENIKLVLRRISDLTEAEEKIIHSLEKSFEDKPHIKIEMWAALTNQYRKFGIDIDGLIDSNQAINKIVSSEVKA